MPKDRAGKPCSSPRALHHVLEGSTTPSRSGRQPMSRGIAGSRQTTDKKRGHVGQEKKPAAWRLLVEAQPTDRRKNFNLSRDHAEQQHGPERACQRRGLCFMRPDPAASWARVACLSVAGRAMVVCASSAVPENRSPWHPPADGWERRAFVSSAPAAGSPSRPAVQPSRLVFSSSAVGSRRWTLDQQLEPCHAMRRQHTDPRLARGSPTWR